MRTIVGTMVEPARNIGIDGGRTLGDVTYTLTYRNNTKNRTTSYSWTERPSDRGDDSCTAVGMVSADRVFEQRINAIHGETYSNFRLVARQGSRSHTYQIVYADAYSPYLIASDAAQDVVDQFAPTVFNIVDTALQTAYYAEAYARQEAIKAAVLVLGTALETVEDVEELQEDIEDAVDDAGETAEGVVADAEAAAEDAAETAGEVVGDGVAAAEGAIETVGQTVDEGVAAAEGVIDDAGDTAGEVVADAQDAVGELSEDVGEAAEDAIATAEAVVATAMGQLETVTQIVNGIVADAMACAGNVNACSPVDPSEVGEDVVDEAEKRLADAQAMADAAIAHAISEVDGILLIVEGLGGDVSETGDAVVDEVNGQISFVFDNLNSTLEIVFDEINFIVGALPEEARQTVQFAVDLATAEAELLVQTAQDAVLFGAGFAESLADSTLATAEIVRQAAIQIIDSLPLYENEETYNTVLDQLFFALDNLVLRFLDEDRAADNAILVARVGIEDVLRAGAGYTYVFQEGGNVDGDAAIDATLAVSGASTVALVNVGFALVSDTGAEAIYEDLVCNRLALCD